MIQVKEHIQRLKAYEPGLQPREGDSAIKLNTNENPYPPSPWVIEAIREEACAALRLYPEPTGQKLREAVASLYGVTPDQIICGNGSDEILGILLRTFTSPGDKIGYYDPSYSYYATLGDIHALRLCPTPLGSDFSQPPMPEGGGLKIFFFTNPNSPLGFSLRPEFVARLATHLAANEGILVVDEAYADFARWNCLSLVKEQVNVIVTRSLSKSYGLAGLRVGLAVASQTWIGQMNKVRDHYNLNRIAQAAACVAFRDQRYFEETRKSLLRTRERVQKDLASLGLRPIPSETNFIFFRLGSSAKAASVYEGLMARNILVRYFPTRGLDDGIRVSIGTNREMDRFMEKLRSLL